MCCLHQEALTESDLRRVLVCVCVQEAVLRIDIPDTRIG